MNSQTRPFQGQLARLEALSPILLAAHGAVILLTLGGTLWTWALVTLTALLGIVGLTGLRGTLNSPLFRAAILLVISTTLLFLSGGTNSYFLPWFFVIVAIYPIVLKSPSAVILPFAVSIIYYLFLPFSARLTPHMVIGARSLLLLFIGVITGRLGAILSEHIVERDILIREASDGIFLADLDRNYLDVNERGCQMSGYTRAEILQMNIRDLVVPEPSSPFRFDELRAGQTILVERTLCHQDGRSIPVEISARMIDGKRLQAIVRDITERKQAEAERERFVDVLEASLNEIYSLDAQTLRFEYVNECARRNLGYSIEAMRALTPLDLKPEFDLTTFGELIEPLRRHQKEKIVFETVHRRADGSHYPVEVHMQLVERGGSAVFLAIINDITERKQAETALRQAEEKYRTIFENAVEGIFRTTVDGRFITANPSMALMLGFSSPEELIREHSDLVKPDCMDPERREEFKRLLEEHGFVRGFEYQGRRKDGSKIWLSDSVRAMHDESGALLYYEGIAEDITVRKRAEAALSASEANYRTLVESASDAILVSDAEGRLVDVNAVGCRMFGYTREELLTMSNTAIIAAVEVPRMEPEMVRLKAGEVLRSDWDCRRKDGRIFPVEVSGTILPDGRLLGILRDVTERKQAEAALWESEQRLRLALDASNTGLWGFNIQTGETYFSREWKSQIGYGDDELEDRLGVWEDLLHPDDRERMIATVKAYAENAWPKYEEEFRLRHKDGSYRWIVTRASLSRDAEGKPWRLLGSHFDITERKRAEEALRESEERYRTLFETAPDGIAVFDPQMEIMMANRRAVEIYGYENSAEVIGLSAYDLIAPQNRPRARENARRVIETGQMPPIESIGVKKDGTHFAVEFRAALIPNSEGQPFAILGVTSDISERKQAEEQLRASEERLRALSARLQAAREEEGTRIAREIHDELGGALTGLKWDLEGIDRVLSGAGNGGRVETVREKIPNMTGLIESTINTVRRISSELRPSVLDDLGLVAAIEWQAQQFQSRTGIKCEYIAGMTSVDLSRDRATGVFRILQEILTNVIRHAEATEVRIELQEIDGYLELCVKDNGRGITEEEMRDKRSLGLLGIRERALLAGGEVSTSGAAGVGTTIVARVPV